MNKTISTPKIENHLQDDEPRWFAVRVQFKREKVVNQRLTESGIQAYLPMQQVVRTYASKTKRLKVPLINGYIFVFITRRDYTPVLADPNVINFVRFNRNLVSIPEHEIELLKRIVGEYPEVNISPLSFSVGEEVEILSGNLTGIRGKLVKKHNRHTFVVSLESLGHELHLQLDASLLCKVTGCVRVAS